MCSESEGGAAWSGENGAPPGEKSEAPRANSAMPTWTEMGVQAVGEESGWIPRSGCSYNKCLLLR